MKLNRKHRKAFTIVELVIVVGVIGILSAILIPTFANLTSKAQQSALKSDLAAVYASYVADAADGYVGTSTSTPLAMYGQGEVVLSKDATPTASKVTGYKFSNTSGWPTDSTANLAVSGVALGNYSGYYVYHAA